MKIAIIGLGRVYEHYKNNFVSSLLENGHIVYLYDIDKKKCDRKLHPQHVNLSVAISFDQLINFGIDFAIVATISGTHYHISKQLLEAGVNVLTEKPATMKEIELCELINLSNSLSLKYGVIFQNRLNKSMKIAKELVEKKYLGDIKICSIKLHWCRYQNYYNDGWHGTWRQDGGVINQQAIHHIDAMQWINGPFKQVAAFASNQINLLEAEDTMTGLVQFESGSVGTIEASTAIRPKDKEASIFIAGTKGFVKVGGVALNKIVDYELPSLDKDLKDRLLKASVNVSSGYGESHKDVIYDFIDSIKFDKNPIISASSTINTVRAIHSLYKSSESRTWVNVDSKSVSDYLGN
ncbi:Gfo/Idh/MocA family protein [Prochlorococcus marinus]|uniref:Oxidoreductase n=1 Tax=Prochlorococcus marinus XMU1408 TaxID=2213228 RepID=A0A318R0V8_PROMR|nr:Gfo/Idh/MocA family oxidoreductase [Prochlorococcus marinus]MBW3042889.1 hypothetical protein [Prochlorococcus marinus str. XMU1408]PYE00247.1 hypothetical protein DNJ73_09200 [Prochlorococcus marinus XMU1408]